jgi:hypothetical protein
MGYDILKLLLVAGCVTCFVFQVQRLPEIIDIECIRNTA